MNQLCNQSIAPYSHHPPWGHDNCHIVGELHVCFIEMNKHRFGGISNHLQSQKTKNFIILGGIAGSLECYV